MKWTSVPLSVLALTVAMGIASMQQVSAQQPPPPSPGGPPPPQMAAPPPDPNAPPPPPSARGPMAGPGQAAPLAQTINSRRGTIKAFNSGPNGETNGFILSDGTAILFPAEMGDQFRATVREGSRISVIGMSRAGVSGRMVVNAQTITANGQTFAVPVPPAGTAPAGLARKRVRHLRHHQTDLRLLAAVAAVGRAPDLHRLRLVDHRLRRRDEGRHPRIIFDHS